MKLFQFKFVYYLSNNFVFFFCLHFIHLFIIKREIRIKMEATHETTYDQTNMTKFHMHIILNEKKNEQKYVFIFVIQNDQFEQRHSPKTNRINGFLWNS